jgi:hypothetical protein
MTGRIRDGGRCIFARLGRGGLEATTNGMRNVWDAADGESIAAHGDVLTILLIFDGKQYVDLG